MSTPAIIKVMGRGGKDKTHTICSSRDGNPAEAGAKIAEALAHANKREIFSSAGVTKILMAYGTSHVTGKYGDYDWKDVTGEWADYPHDFYYNVHLSDGLWTCKYPTLAEFVDNLVNADRRNCNKIFKRDGGPDYQYPMVDLSGLAEARDTISKLLLAMIVPGETKGMAIEGELDAYSDQVALEKPEGVFDATDMEDAWATGFECAAKMVLEIK